MTINTAKAKHGKWISSMHWCMCPRVMQKGHSNVILGDKRAIFQLLNDHIPTKYKPPRLASVGNQHWGEPVIMKAINHFC